MVASKENEENQGFKVSDHRRFNPDGSSKGSGPEGPEPRPSEEERDTKASFESSPSKSSDAPEPSSPGEGLPADFPTLILSLASTAQIGLGIAPHPGAGKVEKNLLQARHAIDLMAVLQEKTKGNLSSEEEQLLQALLTDLRMRFLEASKE